MKLGTKIGLGFGVLVGISLILGGLAIWSMSKVKTVAIQLAEGKVPEVRIGNNIERHALQIMYNTRGYVYSEENEFLNAARSDLTEIKDYFKVARDHGIKTHEDDLLESAGKAETKVGEYEQLLNETVARTQAMDKNKAESQVS